MADPTTGETFVSTLVALLKRLWKASPVAFRLLAMQMLCLVKATQRDGHATGVEPVYVCGAVRCRSGIGASARLYADRLRRCAVRVRDVDVTSIMLQKADLDVSQPLRPLQETLSEDGEGTVVIHANPPHFQLVLCRLGKRFLQKKRLIAFWSWELEAIPSLWVDALRYVDAVEVPSDFIRQTLRRYTTKDITVIPHEVPQPQRVKQTWAPKGVIRCLYIFDAASLWERKNPQAVLQTFVKAFAPGEASLTLKIANAGAEYARFVQFSQECAAVPGVTILTENMDVATLEDLYLRHDVYLSLHRSEGYGLTIREAMLYGLYVVATGWSANMEFMHGERCHAVPYTLVPVRFDHGPYKGLETRWADADVDAAVTILRTLRQEILRHSAGFPQGSSVM